MRRLVAAFSVPVSVFVCRRANWTEALVPMLDELEGVLGEGEHADASQQAAKRVSHWLIEPNINDGGAPSELRSLVNKYSIPASTLMTVPGETDDEVTVSSLRILAFVQAVSALVDQLQSDDVTRGTLREASVQILLEYGVQMVQGKTAAAIRSLITSDVALRDRAPESDISAGVGTSAEISRSLLHATVAVLRVLESDGQLHVHEQHLSRLRVFLRPALVCASHLSVAELCDIGFGLACTSDAPISTSGGFASSGASYEDHNDWVAFAGELVRRLRHQVTPSAMAAKEFSKSSKFAFSLRERKEREKLEQLNRNSETDENNMNLFTVSELASLATSLGLSQFRDATFAGLSTSSTSPPPADGVVTSGQLWDWMAQATCKLVEAEVSVAAAAVAGDDTQPLDLSFSRQDLRSICFACDYAGQPAAYDRIMRMLVNTQVVGAYIPSPSSARTESFAKLGTAIDER